MDLNSYYSICNCFEIIDIVKKHSMSKKISFIIWEENDKKKKSLFSNNTSEITRKKTSDSLSQVNSFNKDLIISPSKKKPSILSDTTNEFKRHSIDKSKNTLSELDPEFEKKTAIKDKFINYCKENKCIVIKIKHYTEISVENEVFWNFLKFLMIKKFESSQSFIKVLNPNKKRFSHFYNKHDFHLGKDKSFNKDKMAKNKSAEKNNFRKSTIN